MMVETDGPWPFEERFKGHGVHPRMIHAVVVKKLPPCTPYLEKQPQLFFWKIPNNFMAFSKL